MKIENQFIEFRNIISKAKESAYSFVNIELINLYWDIGSYISVKINNSEWGGSVVKQLADYLKQMEPDMKGYSSQNLWRMKQFYEIYNKNKKLSPVVREIYPSSNEIFKDDYVLDFLSLPYKFSEKSLQKAIVENLKSFILEFGKDFTFVGEEYRIQVGKKDYYIDI